MMHMILGLVNPNLNPLIDQLLNIRPGVEGFVIVGEYTYTNTLSVGSQYGLCYLIVADRKHAEIERLRGFIKLAKNQVFAIGAWTKSPFRSLRIALGV